MDKPIVQLSVRELAEYTAGTGNLPGSRSSVERAQAGARYHRKVQSEYEKQGNYQREVFLSADIERDGYILRVSGRADGVLSGDITEIHEIKTTYLPTEALTEQNYPEYKAQLLIYGFLYAVQNNEDSLVLRLMYFNPGSDQRRDFVNTVSFPELAKSFTDMVDDYALLSDVQQEHMRSCRVSLKDFAFPFEGYRDGQQELIEKVYAAAANKEMLFAQAPTGTGKTAATLYPALKSLGEGRCNHVFYLTAKTQTASVAEDTLTLFRKKGADVKSIYITAKEKMCLLEKRACNPESCVYCRDYITKLHDALPGLLKFDSYDARRIRAFGRKYELCPFELSLKLSEYCDCIICDYNYVFHPNIRLKRYFSGGAGPYMFLIDEAHNLVERAREIFSVSLKTGRVDEALAMCSDAPRLHRTVTKLREVLGAVTAPRETEVFLTEPPAELYAAAAKVSETYFLLTDAEFAALDDFGKFWLELADFLMVWDNYSPEYHKCYCRAGEFNILCLQTAPFVKKGLKLARSSVLFSATLNPHGYYMTMLGGENAQYFEIPSPFLRENLLVAVCDGIQTAYSVREQCYAPVANIIKRVSEAHPGNYIVYFPSYAFLRSVLEKFRAVSDARCIVHSPNMTKKDKDAFLKTFDDGSPVVGFSVLGGHFGEGIDLTGDRLVGAVIVGVGLPMVSPERGLIKEYFDAQGLDGYCYAYIYPGMNRVLQAAGRVIRTDDDRGTVILVDTRFACPPYDELMPPHWDVHYLSQEDRGLEGLLDDFW